MELRKTSERWNRQFDAEGQATERLESAQFSIHDADGNHVGNADVQQGYANINVNFSGFASVDEGVAKMKALFGINE